MHDAKTSTRWAVQRDYSLLGEIMFEAVRCGPSAYTEAERSAWVPAPRAGPAWNERLAAQDVIIAEKFGEEVGFMSLAAGGYVDFAFLRPAARGQGLFRVMLDRIEARARAKGMKRLWSHVSLNAEPAFTALGFTVRRREVVSIGSERLARCEMEKSL
jgi:putative acetyltransferase